MIQICLMDTERRIKKVKYAWLRLVAIYRSSRLGMALRNKYILTAVVFLVWLLLFDQNNLAERRKMNREYTQLMEEREYYLQKIEEDRKRIEELKTDNDNLEKFAREQYLMKKDNEDIFVIVDGD
jgi:cell division protein DivIC